MPELWFTKILNHLFAGPVTALLHAVGVHPEYPQAPITDAVAMELLVVLFLIVVFAIIRSRLSVDSPGGLQHIVEGLHGFVNGQAEEIIGHGSEKFIGFLTTLGLFILCCNLIGLIPGFESPTGLTAKVPLGCAVLAFLYYNAQGIRKQGLGHYIAHFFGPADPTMSIFMRIPLGILMFPIEIISHCARMLSLTVRLWANIFAGDVVTMVFFSMIPLVFPVVFLGLHIFVAFLQAYIFMLLTIIYLQGAVAVEH